MARQPIPFDDMCVRFHHLWAKQCMLLTAGDFAEGDFNTMAVGWGSLGTLWEAPFVQVVVRPQRYTYGFMERHDTFTLTALPPALRPALDLLGTRSGRDGDKIAASGLTPIASTQVAAPGFDEAELIIECRKMYFGDIDPAQFLDATIDRFYPQKDYHRFYFGAIVAVTGERSYRAGAGG